LPGTQKPEGTGKPVEKKRPVLDLPPVKRVLLFLYDKIFHWYYDR